MNRRAFRFLIPLCVLLFTAVTGTAFADTACIDGMAAGFPCKNVTLVSHLSLDQLGGDAVNGVLANDIWGWTSDTSGNEYVIVGLRDRTTFVNVTDPTNPVVVGYLPSHESGLSDYRDIKVYRDHAFIIGDVPYTAHGMQVFELTQLDGVNSADMPVTFSNTAHFDGVGYGHNLWINEATGFAYIFRSDKCSAATYMVDITDPTNPTTAGTDGCLTVNGADSDAECLIYNGPDATYQGRELCFVGSDDTVYIADVTDKNNIVTIVDFGYLNIRRAHQGVLTPDQQYWLISDTMDEMAGAESNTNTVIIDISDLDNPQYVRRQNYPTNASDHNIYIKDGMALMTNWRSGFRVYDIDDNFADWREVGYFDTHPEADSPGAKSGAWSHYDHLDSNVIAVSDVERGLFMLRVELPPTDVNLGDMTGLEGQSLLGATVALLVGVAAVVILTRRSRMV